MTFDEYYKVKAINASAIKEGRTSMLHMHHAMTSKSKKDTPAMQKGRLIHLACLEPLRYQNVVLATDVDKRTKEYKALVAEYPEHIIISQDEYNEIERIQDSFFSNRNVQAILKPDMKIEDTILWHDKTYGAAKARLDIRTDSEIADIKTTSDISLASLPWIIGRYGYHLQAGWYQEAVEIASNNRLPFIIIWIESSEPYDVCVTRLAEMSVQSGREEAVKIARHYRACEITNCFTGVAESVINIEVPEKYIMKDEVII